MSSESDEVGEGISQQLKNEIRKEAISQVAKWAIGAFVFFFAVAASGWWLYLQEKLNAYIVERAGGVPAGAVIAIDDRRGCASLGDIWEDAGFGGRFIIGAEKGSKYWDYAQTGGDISFTLEAKHMPQIFIGVDPFLFGNNTTKLAVQSIGFTRPPGPNTPLVGGNANPEPIKTLPPFTALYLCRKKK
jgi:hypothetical protein